MNALQQISTSSFYALGAVLGLLVGSFLNVVILRLPRMIESARQAECREFADKSMGS